MLAVSLVQTKRAAIFPLKSCASKCVLHCLAWHADDDGGSCFPSVETIAEWCSLSERRSRSNLRILEGIGCLLTKRSGGRITSDYQLNLPPHPDEEDSTRTLRPRCNTLKRSQKRDHFKLSTRTLRPFNPDAPSANPDAPSPDPLDPSVIRHSKIKVQAYSPTPAVRPDPEASPELGLGDQVLEKKGDPKRVARLELLCRFEKALGSGWPNDSRKWRKRAEVDPDKCRRVIDQVNDAAKHGEIDTDPARYAESQWKVFRSHLPSFNPRTDDERDFMSLVCQRAGVHHHHLEFAWYLRVYRTEIHTRKLMVAKIRKLKNHPDRNRKNWHTIATASVQKEFPELVAA